MCKVYSVLLRATIFCNDIIINYVVWVWLVGVAMGVAYMGIRTYTVAPLIKAILQPLYVCSAMYKP